jgi:hypothetical protein
VRAAAVLPLAAALLAAHPSLAAVGASAARTAAIKILGGDPYGRTPAEVRRSIVGQTLKRDDLCHTGKRVWKFHVVVPKSATAPDGIDGYLELDAANGHMLCANLPLLD